MTASLPVPEDPRDDDESREEGVARPVILPPKPRMSAAEAALAAGVPPRPPLPETDAPTETPAAGELATPIAEPWFGLREATEDDEDSLIDEAPEVDDDPLDKTHDRGELPQIFAAAPFDAEAAVDADADVDVEPAAEASSRVPVLTVRGLTKSYRRTVAVDGIDLVVPTGTFYGVVGPNGAGKTTTLSMIAGLVHPDAGAVEVNGIDAIAHPREAKRALGVLPDRLRTFDRLTGRQLLMYYGLLRGLDRSVVDSRTADLARAFDIEDALARPVSDYSAGMTRKVMLAGAMIHAPRLLVLDEPFEAVDPVSSSVILEILGSYVAHGGTVILSSHGMEMIERVCERVVVLVSGRVLAEGTVAEVRGELTLQQRYAELTGTVSDVEGLEWLHTFSG